MRPLSSPISPTWARLSSSQFLSQARPPHLPYARYFYKNTLQERVHPDELSFERLRLQPAVTSALRAAFPSIKQPTPIQYNFLEAFLNGKDVLLRDKTGTGKSFAAAVALLDQKRSRPQEETKTRQFSPSITSLLLVPHRDLAYQYFHWIERLHHHMKPQVPLPSLAQVLIRDSSVTLEEHLAPIQKTPPHILIATPQAVLDVVQADASALSLDRLSTVVVDEVDYLVESVPVMKDKYAMMKVERQINRHPGATRVLLSRIYSVAAVRRRHSYQQYRKGSPNGGDHRRDDSMRGAPQLVMMSATLRNHLKRFLLADSGWFTGESGRLAKITGSASAYYPVSLEPTSGESEDKATFSVGGTYIQHHVLVCSAAGNVVNIEGATDVSEEGLAAPKPAAEVADDSREMHLSPELTLEPAEVEFDGPSPFDADAMEAIAAAFALDVPSVALLVLRSDAPVQRAVHELRMLGVNARALDVVKDENGRRHLMRRNLDTTAENPTLLVSTLASTRGIDLPQLSHVFILGILDDGAVDSYLHVAGRVGRFGRGGKVISVVADRHEVEVTERARRMRDEPRMMGIIFKKMGIVPAKFEHFVSSGE